MTASARCSWQATETINCFHWCPEKCPWEKGPPENYPQENYPPEKCPRKVVLLVFRCCCQLFIFKLFVVTSFRGLSRTPATFIMDPIVILVNDIN